MPDLGISVQGALRPGRIITWQRTTGIAEDLTDATITGRIRNMNTGATRDIVGALTLTDPSAGVFSWTFAAADVAEAGDFQVMFTATWSAGISPAKTYAATWQVTPAF